MRTESYEHLKIYFSVKSYVNTNIFKHSLNYTSNTMIMLFTCPYKALDSDAYINISISLSD